VTRHTGSCHCGAASLTFTTGQPLAVRACQCSFCRKHGARNVSDPDGHCEIESSITLGRYRFGLGLTDFLFCPTCACYLAAVMAGDGHWRSTVNVNCLDDPHPGLSAEPMVYDAEDPGDRIARRLARWTPTRIVEPEPPEQDSALKRQ
jgi:hypothetical protein